MRGQSEINKIRAMQKQKCIFWIEKHKGIMDACVSKCEGYYFNKEMVKRYTQQLLELKEKSS